MIRYNLIDYMQEQHITPYMLSKISGVSLTYTYNIVRGDMDNPSITIIDRFACALGVEIKDLIK